MKKINKILLATLLLAPISAFAQSATGTQATSTPANSTSTDCVNTALDKRENSLIGGHDSFNAAIKAALTNRLASLKTAWADQDKKSRQNKRMAAYKAFRNESQTAQNNMKSVRLNAWKQFDVDMKACGVKGHGETPQVLNIGISSM